MQCCWTLFRIAINVEVACNLPRSRVALFSCFFVLRKHFMYRSMKVKLRIVYCGVPWGGDRWKHRIPFQCSLWTSESKHPVTLRHVSSSLNATDQNTCSYKIFFLSLFLSLFVSPDLCLPIRCRCSGFCCTWSDSVTESVGLLWTNDRPDAETWTWQHTTHKKTQTCVPPAGWTHNPSRRVAPDPRL